MRSWLAPLAVLSSLAGCAQPQPSAFVGGGAAQSTEGVSLGTNASGESCNQLPGNAPDTVAVFCGTWQQPAATIRTERASGGATPMSVATSGRWRDTIDLRFACDAPVAASILGDAQAAVLQCRRRIGGWPQVALVAAVGGRLYEADGILPTLAVMKRSIGVLSGRTAAATVALPPSAADALLASQLAAHAFSAGDVGEYQRLMALGARSNLAENFATAETAYRAAFALQQEALGRDHPDTVTALMHLALQVSDQGRFAEADTLFKQAAALAPRASDKAAVARLRHYQALHALNQGRTDQALKLLGEAETGYAALVPQESLQAVAPTGVQLASAGALPELPNPRLTIDPTAQSALIGLIEVRRYRAIVLRQLGRPAESAAAIASAKALARANQMGVPLVSARLTRTSATTDDVQGDELAADAGLSASRQNFTQVVPRTRPVAETALLQAGVAAKQGDTARAVDLCRVGAKLLRELRSGTDPALLEPCLASFAAEAGRRAGERQALLAEMFETAELAQDSVTSREIDEAAARLAANARDPRIAEAIRRRQDAGDKLADLYRQRDLLVGNAPPGSLPLGAPTSLAALDKQITDAQADLADADAALQAAAPNYGQLVQQVVPTADVLAALRPDEALAAVTLTAHGGWSFLLREGSIDTAPVKGDAATITTLVKRVRASIESPTEALPKFDTGAAQALYDATLAPVATRLSGVNALVVAPSGPLLSLPFPLLLTGPGDPNALADAPWLIRQMTVAHVPSAANFVALRKAGTSRAAHPWFGFGGFRPVTLAQAAATFPGAACANSARLFASLPTLPFAQRELDAARGLLGAQPTDELLNAAFTAEAVRRTALKEYRILHFATHALLPAELRCQNEPAIVTSAPPGARDASGTLLSASDVAGLDLDANAVILSACNTGGPGTSTGGESLSGLARAFFFAGARSMLVTHWSINDQTSAFLVADTLRRLVAGNDGGLAGALRAAQLGIIGRAGKDLPGYLAHPFYWAPFALIGEGRSWSGAPGAARGGV
ncbi:MAG TPA: CHAT domain-containing tetratricopeptide repeat protein [Acetobacteraceae bacterium]|nr:CHAT domain-containing tetratricopeptide repeat protein [Acetobacteraceae bacterium]